MGKLACCGHCRDHRLALGPVAIYRPLLFEGWWLLDYFLTALVIAWLGALNRLLKKVHLRTPIGWVPGARAALRRTR